MALASFSGRATFDDFDSVREDVSDIVSMISPIETPLLNFLGMGDYPATNIQHAWLENALNPGTITNSTAINSASADTAVQINGTGIYLDEGDLLRINTVSGSPGVNDQEVMQIVTVHGANSITVSRNYGSSGIGSLAAGGTLEFIASSSQEGDDIGSDTSRARTRLYNVTQIFRRSIIISGTQQAVTVIGAESEYERQKQSRTRELLLDLERAVLKGTISHTLGSDSAYRTMRGLQYSITTNVHSAATFTESFLNFVAQQCWTQGAQPDLIVAGSSVKREINAFPGAQTGAALTYFQDNETLKRVVSAYETDYGVMSVLLNRWMDARAFMVLDSRNTKVVNMQRRSFFHQELPPSGDNARGMILGEYTIEDRHEAGNARGWFYA